MQANNAKRRVRAEAEVRHALGAHGMQANNAKRRVQDHFRRLLVEHLKGAGRGAAAAITAATGIKSSTISNIVSDPPTRLPGLDTMHALARYWGRSYADLEAAALGTRSGPAMPAEHPGIAAFLAELPRADPTIVAVLRAEAVALRDVELEVGYFRETYDRVNRALVDARRLALGGAFAPAEPEAGGSLGRAAAAVSAPAKAKAEPR